MNARVASYILGSLGAGVLAASFLSCSGGEEDPGADQTVVLSEGHGVRTPVEAVNAIVGINEGLPAAGSSAGRLLKWANGWSEGSGESETWISDAGMSVQLKVSAVEEPEALWTVRVPPSGAVFGVQGGFAEDDRATFRHVRCYARMGRLTLADRHILGRYTDGDTNWLSIEILVLDRPGGGSLASLVECMGRHHPSFLAARDAIYNTWLSGD